MSLLETRLERDRLRLFDVGARGGVDPRWRRFAASLEVVAFEPDPGECDRLNRETAGLPYPARFLNGALWREVRSDVPFHVANWAVASSIYPPNSAFLSSFPGAATMLDTKEQRRISTTTLDEVQRTEGLAPDCLKLDVEGAELDVLVGGEGVLGDVLVLEIEVEFSPLFNGQPMFWDVDAHLRERGWRLLGLRRNSWRRIPQASTSAPGYGGQLIAADALYVNEGAISGALELLPRAEAPRHARGVSPMGPRTRSAQSLSGVDRPVGSGARRAHAGTDSAHQRPGPHIAQDRQAHRLTSPPRPRRCPSAAGCWGVARPPLLLKRILTR